nr:MAG TPA: hypothetical protein [Caudoviricetes sp.]
MKYTTTVAVIQSVMSIVQKLSADRNVPISLRFRSSQLGLINKNRPDGHKERK